MTRHLSKTLRSSMICCVLLGAATLLPSNVAAQDNSGPVAKGGRTIDGPMMSTSDRSAVINADGSIARGFGVKSVTHTAGAGSYIVIFNRNVRGCSYNASIGLGGASGTSARGFITVVGAAVSVRGVFVTTDDITGAQAERGFHLLVSCG